MPKNESKQNPVLRRGEIIGFAALSGGIPTGIAGAAAMIYFWPILSITLAGFIVLPMLAWIILAGIAAGIIGCLIGGTFAHILIKNRMANYHGAQASFFTSALIGIAVTLTAIFVPIPGVAPAIVLFAVAGTSAFLSLITGIITSAYNPQGYENLGNAKPVSAKHALKQKVATPVEKNQETESLLTPVTDHHLTTDASSLPPSLSPRMASETTGLGTVPKSSPAGTGTSSKLLATQDQEMQDLSLGADTPTSSSDTTRLLTPSTPAAKQGPASNSTTSTSNTETTRLPLPTTVPVSTDAETQTRLSDAALLVAAGLQAGSSSLLPATPLGKQTPSVATDTPNQLPPSSPVNPLLYTPSHPSSKLIPDTQGDATPNAIPPASREGTPLASSNQPPLPTSSFLTPPRRLSVSNGEGTPGTPNAILPSSLPSSVQGTPNQIPPASPQNSF